MRVRFATHAAALKVMNLGPLVTNELLHSAFSQFGDVERAVVVCDDRGRSKGYGIVEFSRRNSAQTALQQVNDGLFLLGRYSRIIYISVCLYFSTYRAEKTLSCLRKLSANGGNMKPQM